MLTLSYRELRRFGTVPRLHPNGFIQLELGTRKARLHVWPEEPIAVRTVDTPIHDHVFRFESRVLLGTLLHFIHEYVEDPQGKYCMWSAGCSAAGRAHQPLKLIDGRRYDQRTEACWRYLPGGRYSFDPFLFHKSVAVGLTATIITIDSFDETASPRVICPVGVEPDSTFRRDAFDPELLWSHIERVFERL